MRWLVVYHGEVVATSATANGAQLARKTMVREAGMIGYESPWLILGPFPGEPGDDSWPAGLGPAAVAA